MSAATGLRQRQYEDAKFNAAMAEEADIRFYERMGL